MKRSICYYDRNGKENTDLTLQTARRRAEELGIRQVVLATTHGYTALRAAEIFAGSGIELIAVGLSYACSDEGWDMTADERRSIEALGVKVLISLHSLSRGVAEAFPGYASPAEIVASTLYCFCQGMKVAVEISLMAAEAGLIRTGREVIAVAGTEAGADTALVLTPAYAWKMKDLCIHEILCMPRGA